MVLPLDVREFSSHKDLAKTVVNHFNQIDILVNNAGRSQRSWVKDTPLHIEQELLDLNLVGTLSLTKAVLPYMLEANSGQVVVVSSVMGKFGMYKNSVSKKECFNACSSITISSILL